MMTMTEPLSDRALAEIEHNLTRASQMNEDAARSYYGNDVSRLLAEVRRLRDVHQESVARDTEVMRQRARAEQLEATIADMERRHVEELQAVSVPVLLREIKRLEAEQEGRLNRDPEVKRLKKRAEEAEASRQSAEERCSGLVAQLRTHLGAMLATVEGLG